MNNYQIKYINIYTINTDLLNSISIIFIVVILVIVMVTVGVLLLTHGSS